MSLPPPIEGLEVLVFTQDLTDTDKFIGAGVRCLLADFKVEGEPDVVWVTFYSGVCLKLKRAQLASCTRKLSPLELLAGQSE